MTHHTSSQNPYPAPKPVNSSTFNPLPRYILDPTYQFDEKHAEFLALRDNATISNYDSGDTIEEVLENIRNLPYEVAVFFDQKHRKIYDFTDYREDTCRLYIPDLWRPHLQVFIHNHPHSNWDFSAQDFLAVAQLGCPTLIVACRNYTYVIENWPRDWQHDAPEQIRSLKSLESFIYNHHFTDDLLEDLLKLFQQAGLNTKYSAYNLKGELANVLPITNPREMPSADFRQFLRALRHLHYVRLHG